MPYIGYIMYEMKSKKVPLSSASENVV